MEGYLVLGLTGGVEGHWKAYLKMEVGSAAGDGGARDEDCAGGGVAQEGGGC